MAIPSFSAFHDEGINLEGLLEILSPENNLVLADDMMVSDGNGIILRVSETYEKNFGFAHDSIVGKSAFDLEADGTFHPLHYGGWSSGDGRRSAPHRPSTTPTKT